MPDIAIYITTVERDGNDVDAFTVRGTVHAAGSEASGANHGFLAGPIRYNAQVINQVIVEAAVAAIEAAESITVGALDRKIVFSGATVL